MKDLLKKYVSRKYWFIIVFLILLVIIPPINIGVEALIRSMGGLYRGN